MNIVLWGYYGSNYGDNIMMEILIDYFKKRNSRITLIDMFDNNLQKNYSHLGNDIKIEPFYKYSQYEKIKKVKEYSKSDINIWGGGTIFTDEDGDGNFKSFSLIKLFGGKIAYVGVGIGNLTKRNRIWKTQFLLSNSEFIVFRDEDSYKNAKRLSNNTDFFVAEDLAYAYFNNILDGSFNENLNNKYIVVSWRNLNGYMDCNEEEKLMDRVVFCINEIVNKYEFQEVILVALDTKYDHSSCELLYSKFSKFGTKITYDKKSTIDNINKLIFNSKFHLSGRLHGSIASEIFGVPTLTLSYSPKIDYFYESIKSDGFINIHDLNIQPSNFERIINSRDSKFINMNDKYQDSILNFKYMDEFIYNQHGNK
ncbi:polysaccharide pyruvyl transferase family protein [Niallia sp.]|uniref:polysaccharide pyruvyl transferase family protein n=1 Tax=Niallia sp. TaxID=2837523 RepID=UPI00289C42DD|nr:polysaccharide pyruvyl transferase family protein [Niallia sp.]